VALDRDDDRCSDQQQELGGLKADDLGIAETDGARDPDGDRRQGGKQHGINGFAVGLPLGDQCARELDQIGHEPRRDHHLDAGKHARCPDQAREPEIEEVADMDRHRGVGAILETVKRRHQRPQRVVAPDRHEIKRHQREVDQSQAGLRSHDGSLPASRRRRAKAPTPSVELARSWRPPQQ